jgi:predicted metal-binding membrane protein
MYDDFLSLTGRVAKFLFFHIVINVVMFEAGRLVLLMATIGRYPRGRFVEIHHNRIVVTGILVVIAAWSVVAIHNNLAH